MKYTKEDIDILIATEAENINEAFEKSILLGTLFLHSAINDFLALLVKDQGEFINGMNLDYRCFVTGLLQAIDKRFSDVAMREVLIPSMTREQVSNAMAKLLETRLGVKIETTSLSFKDYAGDDLPDSIKQYK